MPLRLAFGRPSAEGARPDSLVCAPKWSTSSRRSIRRNLRWPTSSVATRSSSVSCRGLPLPTMARPLLRLSRPLRRYCGILNRAQCRRVGWQTLCRNSRRRGRMVFGPRGLTAQGTVACMPLEVSVKSLAQRCRAADPLPQLPSTSSARLSSSLQRPPVPTHRDAATTSDLHHFACICLSLFPLSVISHDCLLLVAPLPLCRLCIRCERAWTFAL